MGLKTVHFDDSGNVAYDSSKDDRRDVQRFIDTNHDADRNVRKAQFGLRANWEEWHKEGTTHLERLNRAREAMIEAHRQAMEAFENMDTTGI